MVGGLKNVLVKTGHEREREFETLFAELRAEMRKHEPGCVYYSLLKSWTSPDRDRRIISRSGRRCPICR